jgi:adenosylhomocysteine nucleosidase
MRLVLCPLEIELKHLKNSFVNLGLKFTEVKSTSQKFYKNTEWNFALSAAGHGKAQFALQAMDLVHEISDVNAIYCVGSAGSLTREIELFDLVVGEKTIEHDYNVKFIQDFDLPQFTADPNLVSKCKTLANDFKFKVHFGSIASGDEDIVNVERAKELRTLTAALAVAWEGSGGARVAKFKRIPYLEIRSVSDSADQSNIELFKKNLPLCMANLAEFLLKQLKN